MSAIDSLQRFKDLHEAALKGWSQQHKKAMQALWSSIKIAQAHYLLMVLMSLVLGTVTIVQFLSPRLELWALSKPLEVAILLLAGLIWVLLLAFPSGRVYRFKRPWLLLTYTLFGIPSLIGVSFAIAASDVNQFWQGMILYSILSLTCLLLVIAFISLFNTSISAPFFLVFTSIRAGNDGAIFPSYETIICELYLHLAPLLQDDVGQIALIAQHKQTGINGRLQTLALMSGVLALLSLAALVVGEAAIVGGVNDVADQFSDMLRTLGPDIIFPSGVALILTALGVFVIGILWYAFQTYRELRLLEIINLVCALRLAAPAPAAPRAHAATPPVLNAAPPVPATTQPRPLLLVTLLLGLALLRRMLTRR